MRNTIVRVRALMFATVTLSVILLPLVQWTFATFLVALSMYFVYGCIGIGIANHRYWSHKSFEFRNPLIKYACSIAALLSGTGSTLGWSGLHRLHHRHSDTPDDPHQQSRGFWKTVFIFYKVDEKQILRRSMDNARNPFLRFTDRYWLIIILAWIGVLSLISLEALYFIFLLPSAVTMLAQGVTNYVCHGSSGYTTHKNAEGVNCAWLAPFVWGDSWHNNHHSAPTKSNHKEKWWELDISGLLIGLIKITKKGHANG